MNGLFKSYENYVIDPNFKNFNCFLNYAKENNSTNDLTEKIFEIYKNSDFENNGKKKFITLNSNGSTGLSREYKLYPDFIIGEVQKYLRNYKEEVVFLYSFFPFLHVGDIIQNTKLSNKKYSIRFDLFDEKSIQLAIDSLQHYCSKNQITLVTTPNILNFLYFNKEFNTLIKNNAINLTTTDWDAFYPKDFPVFVNDQMINWKSGVNFYTCEFNKKHVLPIFHRRDNFYYNLLNLNNKNGVEIDDLFEYNSNNYLCKCGKKANDFLFIPHYKNCTTLNGNYFYDLNIIAKINFPLLSLQFIQNESEKITVYYTSSFGTSLEVDLGNDVEIEYKKDSIYMIGCKKPLPFWKGKGFEFSTKIRMH